MDLLPRRLFLSLLILSVAACRAPSPNDDTKNPPASVTGGVTYLQRSALPADALVIVRLEDVSRQDAPGLLIGEQDIGTEGRQVPIPYAVLYDAQQIDKGHSYAVSARIMHGDKVLFQSDEPYRVITQGNPTSVDITVKPAP